jgi:PIN domain
VNGLTLDTGALLALERGDQRVRALLERVLDNNLHLSVPAGVIAQAWRGGPRQARVARMLADPRVVVVPLDDATARAVGLLSGRTGHPDIVDVSVCLCARQLNQSIVTSDPDDLAAVDPTITLITV